MFGWRMYYRAACHRQSKIIHSGLRILQNLCDGMDWTLCLHAPVSQRLMLRPAPDVHPTIPDASTATFTNPEIFAACLSGDVSSSGEQSGTRTDVNVHDIFRSLNLIPTVTTHHEGMLRC